MGTLTAIVALGLSAAASSAFAQEPKEPPATFVTSATNADVNPASLSTAHEILAVAFPPEKREQMFSSTLDSLVTQTRQAMSKRQFTSDKDFQALLDSSAQRMFDSMKAVVAPQLPDVFESMAHAYARMFSPDDLTQILAFVKTPAGQHYFQRATEILKDPDVQAANQRLAAKLLDRLPDIQRQTMQDVEAYIAKKEKQEKAASSTHSS
jgi:hypothetical protein